MKLAALMIGEMDKVVPASSHRFTQTSATDWTLSGAAPAETVVITYTTEDMATLKTVSCVLSDAGADKLACKGSASGKDDGSKCT